MRDSALRHPLKRVVWLALWLALATTDATAKRPQIIPEPMLVNLFALTEASASLQVCARSTSYDTLSKRDKALIKRLQDNIDGLVRKIAKKYDEDLFGFYQHTRNEAAAQPDRVETMRKQYAYCGNGMLERMKRYVYDSRQKLDYFLSQQPDAR